MKTNIMSATLASVYCVAIYIFTWAISCLVMALGLKFISHDAAVAALYFKQAIGFFVVDAFLAFVLLIKGWRRIRKGGEVEVDALVCGLLKAAAVLLGADGIRLYSSSGVGGGYIYLIPCLLATVLYIEAPKISGIQRIDTKVDRV